MEWRKGFCRHCLNKFILGKRDVEFGWFNAWITCPFCDTKLYLSDEQLNELGFNFED